MYISWCAVAVEKKIIYPIEQTESIITAALTRRYLISLLRATLHSISQHSRRICIGEISDMCTVSNMEIDADNGLNCTRFQVQAPLCGRTRPGRSHLRGEVHGAQKGGSCTPQ